MNYIGLLPEDAARKEIERLQKLLGILNKLRKTIPQNDIQRACLPIQKQAVKEQIRTTIRYLRKWKVKVKAVS